MRSLGGLGGKKMKGFKGIKKRRGTFMSQRERKKNLILVLPKILCGGQSGMGVGRARGLSEATLGSSLCVVGSRSWSRASRSI